MTAKFRQVFGAGKPVIAMVHFGALPGSPLYDRERGLDGLIDGVAKDLDALQKAGFDAIMFGNENDRPYEFDVDTASTATMAYVIGRVRDRISVPFGVNVLWDPMSSIALARRDRRGLRARDIHRHLCLRHGTVDAGCRQGDALSRSAAPVRSGAALQCLGRVRLFARPAPLPDRARSAVFSSIPDAILVSGQITGEAASMSDLEAVKKALPDTPVLANTGVKHATVADVLDIADGCIVGSSLKVDGNTWNAVDPERAAEFMRLARAARGA